MALFRRRSGPGDGPTSSFWAWWEAEGRRMAEGGLEGGDSSDAFTEAMGTRVRALGEIGWRIAPGETSRRALVITSAGDPAARAVARRAVLEAPPADAEWSYLDTVPAAVDPEAATLVAEGAEIDLARAQVAARMNGSRFDVQVHHPAFADLTPQSRAQVTGAALEAALGELDVALWLGEVQPIEFPPLDGFGLTALRAVIRDHRSRHLDAEGQPRWAMLRGETADGPLVAMVRSPLHPLTAPHLDTYVQLVLPYADRTEAGLPDGGSLQTLRSFEDRLDRALGAAGQVVAHLSTGGSRTLHLYVDSTTGALKAVKDAARTWGEGTASVHDMHDPGWDAVTHLRS